MRINMYNWIEEMINTEEKKALPILSFPVVQMLNLTVNEFISDSTNQAIGIKMISDKYDLPAALSMMDLSVEAEAFGSRTVYSPDEVPTIIGSIVTSEEEAENLRVPEVGEGRTGIYVEGVEKALKLITDKPVLAGTIGPFSLAGRLMDVNEAMVMCYEDPDMVHALLRKSTEFLKNYITAYKEKGAHGVILAEPLAGMLSPGLMREFSTEYVKQLVDELQDENFVIFYHNCGNDVVRLVEPILETGCIAYTFGDAIEMADIMPQMPENVLVMGNISPSKLFRNGTEKALRDETTRVMELCGKYKNFLISSGCDIPPLTDFDQIDAFFDTVKAYYYKQRLLKQLAS